ncbi:MAG: hypothetical protein R6X02_35725 [Enhygromyxa sp.]
MSVYEFSRARGAFFHADARRLAALLPPGLRPLESHPELGVLALSVFDFHTSEVGPYRELVVSVVVAPWVARGEPLPHSAVFPVLLATTTERSRSHAAERWKLPELDRLLTIELDDSAELACVRVDDGARPLFRLRVGLGPQGDARRIYQCFSRDAKQLYRANIEFAGPLAEHEDERGELELGDHPLATWLGELLDDPIPFREQSMGRGEERYGSLTPHASEARQA